MQLMVLSLFIHYYSIIIYNNLLIPLVSFMCTLATSLMWQSGKVAKWQSGMLPYCKNIVNCR